MKLNGLVNEFLPVSGQEMKERGWESYDFLIITGDAYVDHPSFGTAIISRLLESKGFRVAVCSQPDWHSTHDLTEFGKPRLGVMLSAGNLDSMVAHYTVAKRRRSTDAYSPGNRTGLRPDRAVIVYSNLVRQAFGEIPLIIGGLEASLRRFAHYDYWEDKVRRCILMDAGADLLVYGMGERATVEIAQRLAAGTPVKEIRDVKGTAFLTQNPAECVYPKIMVAGFDEVSTDKRAYAQANMVEYQEHDPIVGKAVLQPHGKRLLVVNPPAMPLNTAELDEVFALPYAREPHPMYDDMGGVPAIEEVRFSLIRNRGCFGACNFCSLAFHQGRIVTSRSQESLLKEAKLLIAHPEFKGYIHDVGGPTANFTKPACQKQMKAGLCKNRACLSPGACPNLDADESEYLELLRKLRALPGVKKVFIRSGIRFDYLEADKSSAFLRELVQYHVSGQLKVAPEHCVDSVLDYMGKPHNAVYERFRQRYDSMNQKYGMKQYLVPYLMSSHPGCTLDDAIALAQWLNRSGRQPEQVQDFYPTPGTLSTCMYHTGLDPRTMEAVFVPKTPHEKAMQRALMQWKRPEKRALVLEALKTAGREDLIGFSKECLLRPGRGENEGKTRGKPGADPGFKRGQAGGEPGRKSGKAGGKPGNTWGQTGGKRGKGGRTGEERTHPVKKKTGWAKAKPKPNARKRK